MLENYMKSNEGEHFLSVLPHFCIIIRIYFTKKLLDKKKIIYGIKTAKKGKVFEDEILKFSVNIDSDLVVLIINKFKKMVKEDPNYDATIPFLVINRNSEVVKYGGSFR